MQGYASKSIVQKKQMQKFLKLVKDTLLEYQYTPSRIIDVGGADGVLAKALKNSYPHAYVVCLDKDQDLIKEGEKKWEGIEFICKDFLDFKAEGVFDLVVSTNTYHWFDGRWLKAIENTFDILEEGGWFFLHQGGRWTYHFLYVLGEEIYEELTGRKLKHTDILYYPTLREFRERLSEFFSVIDAFSKIELSEDYNLEELIKSFSVAGAKVFLDVLDKSLHEKFLKLLQERALELEVPVFGRRLYAIARKRLNPVIRRGRLSEIEWLIEKYEHEFVPPLSQRGSAGGELKGGSLEQYLKSLLSSEILIAEKDQKVIACLCYQKRVLFFTKHPVAYVSTVIVDKPYRRTGVAKALYKELISKEKQVYVRTWSSNHSHIKLLLDLGFKEAYRVKDERGKGEDTIYYCYERV